MDALAYSIPDPEDLMECPYNKYHMIRAKRFQYHLMKCRQQYIGAEFHVCPFNAKHEMPKPELRYHISICPDRARIAADLIYEQSRNSTEVDNYKGCTDVPSYHYDFKMPEPTENWDLETLDNPRIGVEPSFFYNPQRIKDTTGMTRAEKKAFEQYLINPQQNGFVESEAERSALYEPQGSRIRTPQSTPMVYQQAQQQLPKPTPKPSSIFAYSLSMAGVGRGRGMVGAASGQPAPGHSHQSRPGADNSADGAAVLMAMARGRGMGRAGYSGMSLGGASAVSSSESPDSDSAASRYEPDTDAKKREAKKLQKKLRQIQALEDKQDAGENLENEELEKISKREELEKALECLSLD